MSSAAAGEVEVEEADARRRLNKEASKEGDWLPMSLHDDGVDE